MILHMFCVIELWKRNYSFTGCDTTSKLGTKDKASKVASNKRHQYQLAKFDSMQHAFHNKKVKISILKNYDVRQKLLATY